MMDHLNRGLQPLIKAKLPHGRDMVRALFRFGDGRSENYHSRVQRASFAITLVLAIGHW